jgi:hypothetical protein
LRGSRIEHERRKDALRRAETRDGFAPDAGPVDPTVASASSQGADDIADTAPGA